MLLNNGKKRIPIGYEDFKEIIDGSYYYVDKSMLIYELLTGGGKNNLMTRPRRFGKTLNLSMLRYFFDINEKDNRYLFDGLKISEHYGLLSQYRNAHPVIMLSLKSAKQGSYDEAMKSLKNEIRREFLKNKLILGSGKVNDELKADFSKILAMENDAAWGSSVQLLSACLKEHYGANTIILIDEYDVPLEDAYFSGYYDRMVNFIRSLFESALKTNPALEFSVITGCLRISKESIFTGLNNLKTNSIMNVKYSECFGFEEFEVRKLLGYYGLEHKFESIKRWYDGYLFGNTEIYNPWSIMCYIDDLLTDPDEHPKANWINTSSNSIIRSLIEQSDSETRSVIERLMNGGSVVTHIKETVTYGDLKDGSENIWSFLLFTGYLKIKELISSGEETGEPAVYSLVIPNLEIKSCYSDIIIQYFETYKRAVNKNELYTALLSRDAAGFAAQITGLLKRSISFYDHTEAFYHGLISGLLSGNVYYKLESNREAGSGRSDLILYQQDSAVNAVIMEFKVCRGNEPADTAAKRALKQINDLDYAAEAVSRGYKNIIKYGVAFKDKICFAVAG